jgi:hypothetical protein
MENFTSWKLNISSLQFNNNFTFQIIKYFSVERLLGYPLTKSKSLADFSPSGDLTLCISKICLKSLTTNSSNPNAIGSLTLGNTTYYGIPRDFTYEITEINSIDYLMTLIPIKVALSTNDTVFWHGADPYQVIT